jgi:cation transport protein ChaC
MGPDSTPPETGLPPAEYWPETSEEDRIRLGWLTDGERQASLDATLAQRAAGQPIWVFGYGSLLWKPAFQHADSRMGLLRGYHRRFCLIVNRFRGSEETPGLMLSLDRGGVCRSLALQLHPATEMADIRALWRREMVSNGYIPRWCRIETDAGEIRAIAFVSNRRHKRYLRPGTDEEAAMMIARACGPVGSCAEYLHSTHEHLLQLGINDRGLARMDKLVRERLAKAS